MTKAKHPVTMATADRCPSPHAAGRITSRRRSRPLPGGAFSTVARASPGPLPKKPHRWGHGDEVGSYRYDGKLTAAT